MTALLERLGGIVIAPRETLQRLIADGPGGFNDLLLLLALQTIALRLPEIGRIGWHAVDTSAPRAVLLLVNLLARSMMIPLIAALAGSLLLRVVGGAQPADRRTTDIAALCVVPSITLQLAASALAVALPTTLYTPSVQRAVQLTAAAWLAGLLALAAVLLRRERAGSR